jgi:alpha-tubulin suppressor-like RCC1 family protein
LLGADSADVVAHPAPRRVPGLAKISRLALGATQACAVDDGGGLRCWGDAAPTLPPSPALRFTDVAAGWSHGCGLVEDGQVLCWGDGSQGQRGDGRAPEPTSAAAAATPTPVKGLPPARRIFAGGDSSCAIGRDDAVYCWGDDQLLQLGPVRERDRCPGIPPAMFTCRTQVRGASATRVRAIATGATMTCVLAIEGAVTCWGDPLLPHPPPP